MNSAADPAELKQSLANWVWLGELCQRLVDDHGLAEDAQQAAWLTEATNGSENEPNRARLFWAARRFITGTRRANERRTRRERSAARHEALPSPEELVERSEQRQRVWTAVLNLPDPSRTTLLLHFQDGLSPREIAERSDDKVNTVRHRIRHGVALLRERLGSDHEGGGLAALAVAIPGLHDASRTAGSAVAPPFLGIAASIGALTVLKITVSAFAAFALALIVHNRLGHEPVATEAVPVGTLGMDATHAVNVEGEHFTAPSEEPSLLASRESLEVVRPPTAAGADVPSLSGRLILHDVDGTLLPGPYDGTLQLSVLCNGGVHRGIDAKVTTSEFSLGLVHDPIHGWGTPDWDEERPFFRQGCDPATLSAWIDGGELEGPGVFVMIEPNGAIYEPRRHIEVDFGESDLELHAQAVPPFTLHVLDESNRAVELQDVDVVFKERFIPNAFPPLRDESATILATAEESPLTIHPTLKLARGRRTNCYVRSPGFAWKAIELNLSSGGERTLTLDRGGSLDVRTQGQLPEKAVFRIYRDGESTPLAERSPEKETEFTYTNLPTGDLTARIELGPWYDGPLVVAEQTVRIEAGRVAHCLLAVKDLELPTPVECKGTLFVPVSWDIAFPDLYIERLSPTTGSEVERMTLRTDKLLAIEGQPGLFAFDTGGLIPGDHVAVIHELSLQIPFTVPVEGASQLKLVVPEPAVVSVMVRDEVTGEPAMYVEHLAWQHKWPSTAGYSAMLTTKREEGESEFHLRLPRGPVEVSVHGAQSTSAQSNIDATDGLVVELTVRQAARARIILTAASRPMAWPSSFPLSVIGIQSGTRPTTTGEGPSGRQFSVTVQDRYRVELPELDGFAPVDPLELEMRPGEPEQRVVVEYRRVR